MQELNLLLILHEIKTGGGIKITGFIFPYQGEGR
jgi:hypothetical protein